MKDEFLIEVCNYDACWEKGECDDVDCYSCPYAEECSYGNDREED